MASDRHRERLTVGLGALLTLGEAAALLPMSDSEARAWLRDQRLVRYLNGRPVVVWADVLEAVPCPDAPPEPQRRKPTPLPRVRL